MNVSYEKVLRRSMSLSGFQFADKITNDELAMRDFINLGLDTIWTREPWGWVIEDISRTFTDAKLNLDLFPTIDAVFRVFKDGPDDNPLLCRDKVRSELEARILHVYSDSTLPDNLFVRSRPPVPEFEGGVYNVATAYIAGDKVIYASTTGTLKTLECWVNILASTGVEPSTVNAVNWVQLAVPSEFTKYLIVYAATDWLQGEGQLGKHRAEKVDLKEAEMDLYDLLERQEGENEFPMIPVQPSNN